MVSFRIPYVFLAVPYPMSLLERRSWLQSSFSSWMESFGTEELGDSDCLPESCFRQGGNPFGVIGIGSIETKLRPTKRRSKVAFFPVLIIPNTSFPEPTYEVMIPKPCSTVTRCSNFRQASWPVTAGIPASLFCHHRFRGCHR